MCLKGFFLELFEGIFLELFEGFYISTWQVCDGFCAARGAACMSITQGPKEYWAVARIAEARCDGAGRNQTTAGIPSGWNRNSVPLAGQPAGTGTSTDDPPAAAAEKRVRALDNSTADDTTRPPTTQAEAPTPETRKQRGCSLAVRWCQVLCRGRRSDRSFSFVGWNPAPHNKHPASVTGKIHTHPPRLEYYRSLDLW